MPASPEPPITTDDTDWNPVSSLQSQIISHLSMLPSLIMNRSTFSQLFCGISNIYTCLTVVTAYTPNDNTCGNKGVKQHTCRKEDKQIRYFNNSPTTRVLNYPKSMHHIIF
jgi:hypothetical protein